MRWLLISTSVLSSSNYSDVGSAFLFTLRLNLGLLIDTGRAVPRGCPPAASDSAHAERRGRRKNPRRIARARLGPCSFVLILKF
jgi:hypothetical protein